ncbi:protein kinase [Roseiconus nitratireducens]|uniref:Protein kinase n=1 Tax=Roseiconus nitratireducens TaxID=2605748 RepID=A0A5M6DLR7_9BACT|nr:WD40 repeat domain-containing serine/threonine-protein kinase [Roseiconus nitratireducens]KAA5547169.1 protein kinase [Roseiconus nitratireducens]
MNGPESETAGGMPDESREKWITIDRLCDAYEASLQDGRVERAPFLAGVPDAWRDQLGAELDAIDAAYRDAAETRAGTAIDADSGGHRLGTPGNVSKLASLGSKKVWLGRFEIKQRLGTGSTGSVWCARDARLARWVALKIPHATRVMSDTTAARFQTEARAAAAITHPNVVQVYEVLIEDGLPILVQQWIDGPSLAQHLKRHGPMNYDLAADWMTQIADAVACAHDRGIVHRDLKPANVMLNEGRPMVLDFGLASYPAFSSGLTTEGTVLGTPAYMSPEQAEGTSDANQPPSDIYALGTILYEMIVGSPPFVGKTREVLLATKSTMPAPPRSRRAGVPRDLETIILRCLTKSPQGRYRSAADLRDDLKRFRRREPIRARKVSALENAWSWCRSHPVYALLAIGVPLVALLTMAMTVSQVKQHQLSDRADALAEQQNVLVEERSDLLVERDMIQLARASLEMSLGNRTRGLQILDNIPEALRGWEWRLLDSLSTSPNWQLLPRQGRGDTPITSLAMTPDQSHLFASAEDGCVWQWQIDPGEVQNEQGDWTIWNPHHYELICETEAPVRKLVTDPQGRFLAWIQGSADVALWDLRKGKFITQLARPDWQAGLAITFAGDGRHLLVGGGSRDDSAPQTSWLACYPLDPDGIPGEVVERGWNGQAAVTGIVSSAAGQFVISRGGQSGLPESDGMVERWTIADPLQRRDDLLWRGLNVNGLALDPDAHRLAWCDGIGVVYVMDHTDPTRVRAFRIGDHVIRNLRFSPDGRFLSVGGEKGFVARCELPNPAIGDPVEQTPINGSRVRMESLAYDRFRGHENLVEDSLMFVARREIKAADDSESEAPLRSVHWLLTAGADGRVLKWGNPDPPSVRRLFLPNVDLADAAWVSDDRIAVATASRGRRPVVIYRERQVNNSALIVEQRHTTCVERLSLRPGMTSAPSPEYLVACRDRILLCQSGAEEVVVTYENTTPDERFSAACLIGSDWMLAATAATESEPKERNANDPARTRLLLFDRHSGQLRLTRPMPQLGKILRLGLSPDRSAVLGVTADGHAFVLALGQPNDGGLAEPARWFDGPIMKWKAHERAIQDFDWIGGGDRLATVSDDGTCAIWRARPHPGATTPESTGDPILEYRLLVSSAAVTRVSASFSGDRLVTVGLDRVIRVWDTRSGLELVSLEPRQVAPVAVQISPDDRYLMIAETNVGITTIDLDQASNGSRDD